MLVPFARKSNAEEYSRERLLNYSFRPVESGVSAGVLIARSGLNAQVNPGTAIQQMAVMAGDIYAVAGGTVYKYDISAGTVTSVGAVSFDEQVSIAASGTEVAIVTANTYYICDGSTTTSYATGAVTNPQWVVFVDGYFIVSGTVSGRDDALTNSGLDDGTTFGALDYAFAENAPDAIRGLAVLNNRVWAFGAATAEKFWNAGTSNFPFAVSKSETIAKGILNGRAWAEIDSTLCWVAQNNIVYRSAGGSPVAISTLEVKEALDDSEIENCYAFVDRGHEFFAIRRRGDTTLCYDVITQLWSERSTEIEDNPWIVTSVAEVDGVQYYGTDTGKICTATRQTYTDDGQRVLGEAISVPVMQNGEEFSVDEINLRAVAPNALASGVEGQIILQMSDNGMEWGTEQWESLGAIGEYNRELLWTAQGTFTRAQMRLRVTDPVPHDLHGVTYKVS